MNRMLLAALVGLAILAEPAHAARDAALREQSRRSFDATGLRLLRVDDPRGLVEVHTGPPGRIDLTALKLVRAPEPQRARLARDTRVETSTQGGVLTLRVIYPQGAPLRISLWDVMQGYEAPKVEVRLALDVPPGLAIELDSASGDLRTAGLTGPQTLSTTSGDIEVLQAAGPLKAEATSGSIDATSIGAAQLRSVSGDVVVDGVRGALAVRTTSGDISVRAAQDSLRLQSVSGDITVSAAPRGLSAESTSGRISASTVAGAVEASSSSGDVDVRGAAGLGATRITSVSGDVALQVPTGFGGTFELTTASGALDATVGLEVKTVSRHVLRGILGDGRTRVILKSSSGDIHVTSGGR